MTITLSAADESGGTGVLDVTYGASGAQTIAQTTPPGASASLTVTAEGETTVTYFATGHGGRRVRAEDSRLRGRLRGRRAL